MSGHRALEDNYLDDATLEDPGDAGTIAVNRTPCVVELVTAAAETRTLADPLKSGLILALTLKTDGGNCVVTASTAVNETGNNTITFTDDLETVTLISIPNGASGYRWSVVGTNFNGGGLSTV